MKYRLYDIDVVIGQAVVFTVWRRHHDCRYRVVDGVGTLVGNDRSPLLSAVAAAVVAVAFQPVRERARRLANRVVYGKRATPYEVRGLRGACERVVLHRRRAAAAGRVLAEGIGSRACDRVAGLVRSARVDLARRRNGSPGPSSNRSRSGPPGVFRPGTGLPVVTAASCWARSGRVAGDRTAGPERDRLVPDVAAQTGLVPGTCA